MTYHEERIRQIVPTRILTLFKKTLPDATRRRLHAVARSLTVSVGKVTSWQRCLPNFVIIGAMRSGTTTLYNLIGSTRAAIPAAKKEVHYFDNNFDRDLSWYRSHFCTIRLRDRIHAELGQPVACGEASPYYLYHRRVPSRMSKVLPDARLIAILRDPVERAYSHYWLVRRRGDETRHFDEIVQAELANQAETGGRDVGSDEHQWLSYLERGLYVRQLARWLEHFDRNQLLVLRTSDLRDQPDAVLSSVAEHLGQEPRAVVPDGLELAKRQNTGSYPPMSSNARTLLEDFYGDWEARVDESIGWG